ncbi:MAG: type II toxin-antitoxin system VapC family toxin [Opitutales bacterium]
MKAWLLDTGPLIAALNRRDPYHQRCAAALASHTGDLLTTGAVVTEAMHFLGGEPNGAETLAGFLADAQVGIRDCFGADDLQAAARLMKKYADTPMDFADATLVLLAEESGCNQILTLDERGFRAYRYRGKSRFTLVLDR